MKKEKTVLKIKKNLVESLLAALFIALSILIAQKASAQEKMFDGKDFQYYEEGNKYGFKDVEGNIVIPARYDDLSKFREGYVAVNIGAELKKVKVSEGYGMIPAEYAERLIGGKWGFVDVTGKEIIPCKYDFVSGFYNGIASVNIGGTATFNHYKLKMNGGKWGFVDTGGKEIVPCKYESIGESSDGLIAVSEEGKWGFIDNSGNTVIPCIYDETGSFTEKLVMVKSKNLYGYIDRTGNIVVPLKYISGNDFSEGLALVESPKKKYGFVDTTGNEIIPCKYDMAESFSEGLAAVNIGGKSRAIRKEFSAMLGSSDYSEFRGGKWGFIDKKGNLVIPLQYDHVESFKNGRATVNIKGKPDVIDKPEILKK